MWTLDIYETHYINEDELKTNNQNEVACVGRQNRCVSLWFDNRKHKLVCILYNVLVFCPECGQKNKGSKITFATFLKEVFNGFISLDAKVWTTLIPLLIKPGKVSRDFIEGRRARYTNPFQFYISVSIVFFLILFLNNYNTNQYFLKSYRVKKCGMKVISILSFSLIKDVKFELYLVTLGFDQPIYLLKI